MLILKSKLFPHSLRNRWALLSAVLLNSLVCAPQVLAKDEGGALPDTNPFQADWSSVMDGGVVGSLLPLIKYGLGLYGLWLLFHSVRHLLGRSKDLMAGKVSFKEFIPVIAGLGIILLVLSGAWYHLLLSILVPINKAFSGTP